MVQNPLAAWSSYKLRDPKSAAHIPFRGNGEPVSMARHMPFQEERLCPLQARPAGSSLALWAEEGGAAEQGLRGQLNSRGMGQLFFYQSGFWYRRFGRQEWKTAHEHVSM